MNLLASTHSPLRRSAGRRRATAVLLAPVVASTAALALAASPASAAVPGAGAVAPVNGVSYPSYYQDASGLQLKPCLNALHCGAVTAADVLAPDGEFFYNLVEGNAGPFRVVIGLEGAFDPVTGVPITFNRMRFRAASGLNPGATYTIVHPYGSLTVKANADGSARSSALNVDDEGCAPAPGATCDFGAAMPGGLEHPAYTRFLTSSGDTGADGFMDNDGVAGPITGSPTGNNSVKVYEGTATTGTPVFSQANFTVQAAVAAPGTTPTPTPVPTPTTTVPDAPAAPVATRGRSGGAITASATWNRPANDGGSAITSYTIQAFRVTAGGRTPLGLPVQVQGTSITMTFQTQGQVAFKVLAHNANGDSPYSGFSNTVRAR